MMKTYTQETSIDIYGPLLGEITLASGLIIVEIELRSELNYIKDRDARKTALTYISAITSNLSCNFFYLLADNNIAPVTKLRSKKWERKYVKLFNDDAITFEVEAYEAKTRLGVLLNLHKYAYDYEIDNLLNWLNGVFILTSYDYKSTANIVPDWISKVKSGLRIDYQSIVRDLSAMNEIVIMRYFLAVMVEVRSWLSYLLKGSLNKRFRTL